MDGKISGLCINMVIELQGSLNFSLKVKSAPVTLCNSSVKNVLHCEGVTLVFCE